MAQWQDITLQGNEAYRLKQWDRAEVAYCKAVSTIEAEWFVKLEDISLLMGWVANMHNLGCLYEQTDNIQQASHHYLMPYRRVLLLMKEDCFSTEFQHYLLYAMRTVSKALLNFSHRHRVCQCCEEKMAEIREWLKQYPQPLMMSAYNLSIERSELCSSPHSGFTSSDSVH
ncbi:hypothetical protein GZ77_03190 [Endozoicomonas montiporae]|uniref:Tetratricopeptide repeat protein n=2 Tax=Endozoicomonas montiporae TaxID=1027273 RepID=A0A081NAZ2_9GAMM|nr:hypothetical protein [Endozoicomonas montiporae]AMO56685.1 hypothetical protein EZMO1_2613 [Endozoicomonas montiporae CL-33]KEQ15615.1 hypothetical protein GZ77_03190 [Endozoicomonas montiporae]